MPGASRSRWSGRTATGSSGTRPISTASRTSILDGTSSQAASNWGNVYMPGDPNNPPLTRSNFDPGHRITVSGGYDIPMPAGLTARRRRLLQRAVRPAVVGELRRRLNGDVRGTNDLLYIPTATDHDRLHQRHVRRPADLRQRRAVPVGLHRQDPRAQCLPVARGSTRST